MQIYAVILITFHYGGGGQFSRCKFIGPFIMVNVGNLDTNLCCCFGLSFIMEEVGNSNTKLGG